MGWENGSELLVIYLINPQMGKVGLGMETRFFEIKHCEWKLLAYTG